MSRLDEIRARVEAATPGPWKGKLRLDDHRKVSEMWGSSEYLLEPVVLVPHDDIIEEGCDEVRGNWAFISHAREDILFLLDLVERAKPFAEIMAMPLRPRYGPPLTHHAHDAAQWLTDAGYGEGEG